jgi:adenine deaminase
LRDTQALIEVSRGERPADIVLTNADIVFVQSGEILRGHVAIHGGRIAYAGPSDRVAHAAARVIDCSGRPLVPGYVDPHAHLAQMANPVEFAKAILRRGTTTVVADTLFLLVLADPMRAPQVMEALHRAPVRFHWFVRVHQPGAAAGGALFDPRTLGALMNLPSARAIGELARWMDVYRGDPAALQVIERARLGGLRAEGHSPGASFPRLQALAAGGVTSDHEAITEAEVLDRLRSGLWVMLRHSSLRRDLPALIGAAKRAGPAIGRLMLTPDGTHPHYLRRHGYLDDLVRRALDAGVDPVTAYALVTLNPATYYGLDDEAGMIAPGRAADVLVLRDVRDPTPERVLAKGRLLDDDPAADRFPPIDWPSVFPPRYADAPPARAAWFEWPADADGRLPGMRLESAVIARAAEIAVPARGGRLRWPPGVVLAALVDARGRWMARAPLAGFAERLGAVASTYNVVHDVVVCGQSAEDMAAATRRVREMGGGIALCEGGRVLFEMALPYGGMMGASAFDDVADGVERLEELLAARGHPHHDVLYSLLFLPFDTLPDVRLTDRGLWDVKAERALLPAVPLA